MLYISFQSYSSYNWKFLLCDQYLTVSLTSKLLETTILLSVSMTLTTLDFTYNLPVSQFKKNYEFEGL